MRKWHRWISLPALLFLLILSTSGLVLQVQGYLNDDEENSEKLEQQKSRIKLSSLHDYATKFELAQKAVLSKSGDVEIKKFEVELRHSPPMISLYTDETHPRIFQVNAETSQIISEKLDDTDRFWVKLHSGELLGDAGRGMGVFAGLSLLFLTVSGFWIYLQMYRRRPKSGPRWKIFFW